MYNTNVGTRRQWLARLTEGGSLGSSPGGSRARAQLGGNSGSPGSLRRVAGPLPVGGASASRIGDDARAQPVRRHRPGGPSPRFRPKALTTGSTTIPAGLIVQEAEDPGGHRAQRLRVTWDLEAAGLGVSAAVGGPAPSTRRQWLARLTAEGSHGSPPGGLRARAQLGGNSGSPGSLRRAGGALPFVGLPPPQLVTLLGRSL